MVVNFTHLMGVARSWIRPLTTMAEQSINKPGGQGGESSVYSKLKRQIFSGNKIKSCVNSGCGLVILIQIKI